MTLLHVEDLHLSFFSLNQTTHAIRGVNLEIKKGETIGLVGESGSGKSALAKSLIGLNPSISSRVDKGSILYQGEDLLLKSERSLQKIRGKEIAMIFQDPMAALNPTMKVGKQIAEGYRLHYPKASRKEVRERALTLLFDVGIAEPRLCYQQYPHELSGGMRQRAMIATAIISSPTILLADEPTTALDVTIQAQILKLLKEIQSKQNMSILLITHDLSIAAQFCDRILVMYAGQIVERAPIEKIFESPEHPYTRALLNSIPKLHLVEKQKLDAIPGSPPDLSLPLTGCSFCPRCLHKTPICSEKSPTRFSISENHSVRCWLQGEKP